MLIFFFLILVTIKAVSASMDYWKDVDDGMAEAEAERSSVRQRPYPASAGVYAAAGQIRSRRSSSVRVTPIKRVKAPSTSYSHYSQNIFKDKGAA